MGLRALKTHFGGLGRRVGEGGRQVGGRWASLSTVLQRLLLIVLIDIPPWHSANGRAAISPSYCGECSRLSHKDRLAL